MDVGVRQTGCAAGVTHLLGQSPGLPKGVTVPLGHCHVKVSDYLPGAV